MKVREVRKVRHGYPVNWATQLSSDQASNSSYSYSASDEDEVVQSGPGNTVTYSIYLTMDTALFSLDSVVHTYAGSEEGMTVKCHTFMTAPVHLMFSTCVLLKLSHCWWWRLINIIMITLRDDEGTSPIPDTAEAEMFVFLATTNIWDIVYRTN
jgi:hypothetical protein